MSIKVDNISYQIKNKQILKDVSFDSTKGNMIGIIGPNGSGKSTLIKCISKLITNYTGTITINNTNIKNYSYATIAKEISLISQTNNLEFDFMVSDYILLGRSIYHKVWENNNQLDYQLLNDILEQLNIKNLKDSYLRQLSGGELQKINIAQGLIKQCPYLILDEPTNHLDITMQIEIMNHIKQLSNQVIIVLHDLNKAFQYCDYLYVLDKGQVIIEGKPEDIMTSNEVQDIFNIDITIINNPTTNQKELLFNLKEK